MGGEKMLAVADFIDRERYKRDISRDELTKGICSSQFLQKAQKESLDIDVLLFEILMERMDLSTDELEYILTEEDLSKVVARDEIEFAVEQCEFEKALSLLNKYYAKELPEDPIAKMYYLRTKAQILAELGYAAKLNEAREDIVGAIKLTLDGIGLGNYKEYMFSTYEAENILMYAKILYLMGESVRSVELLEKCFAYFDKAWTNENLLIRVIPKCAYLISCYGVGIVSDGKIAEYCERGLYLLRKGSILYMLKPLMEKTINCYKRLGNTERVDYWKPYYDLLVDFYDEYGNDRDQTSMFFRWKTTGYYLDSEVVKGERLNKGYTQEELAEGVYNNPSSISNLEKGKSAPNKTKYKLLFDKLGIDKARYSGFVIAESYEKIERIVAIRNALSKHEYEKLIRLIDNEKTNSELEESLLGAYRTVALAEEFKDKREYYREMMKTEVERVFPIEENKCNRKPFQAEMDVLIAFLIRHTEDEIDNYVPAIEKILLLYNTSKVSSVYNYRTYTSISILAIKFGIKVSVRDDYKSLIKYCIKAGKGSALVGISWREGIKRKKDDPLKKKLLYMGYMFTDLFLSESASARRAYYEQLYKPSGKKSSPGSIVGSSSPPAPRVNVMGDDIKP